MNELRKEYADLRFREQTEQGSGYRGLARIPAARRWMLRKYEAHKRVVENEGASKEQRAQAAYEMRSLHSQLQRLGVFKS